VAFPEQSCTLVLELVDKMTSFSNRLKWCCFRYACEHQFTNVQEASADQMLNNHEAKAGLWMWFSPKPAKRPAKS